MIILIHGDMELCINFYTLDNIVNLNTILVNLIFILYYILEHFLFLILKNKIINFIPIIILFILISLIERLIRILTQLSYY